MEKHDKLDAGDRVVLTDAGLLLCAKEDGESCIGAGEVGEIILATVGDKPYLVRGPGMDLVWYSSEHVTEAPKGSKATTRREREAIKRAYTEQMEQIQQKPPSPSSSSSSAFSSVLLDATYKEGEVLSPRSCPSPTALPISSPDAGGVLHVDESSVVCSEGSLSPRSPAWRQVGSPRRRVSFKGGGDGGDGGANPFTAFAETVDEVSGEVASTALSTQSAVEDNISKEGNSVANTMPDKPKDAKDVPREVKAESPSTDVLKDPPRMSGTANTSTPGETATAKIRSFKKSSESPTGSPKGSPKGSPNASEVTSEAIKKHSFMKKGWGKALSAVADVTKEDRTAMLVTGRMQEGVSQGGRTNLAHHRERVNAHRDRQVLHSSQVMQAKRRYDTEQRNDAAAGEKRALPVAETKLLFHDLIASEYERTLRRVREERRILVKAEAAVGSLLHLIALGAGRPPQAMADLQFALDGLLLQQEDLEKEAAAAKEDHKVNLELSILSTNERAALRHQKAVLAEAKSTSYNAKQARLNVLLNELTGQRLRGNQQHPSTQNPTYIRMLKTSLVNLYQFDKPLTHVPALSSVPEADSNEHFYFMALQLGSTEDIVQAVMSLVKEVQVIVNGFVALIGVVLAGVVVGFAVGNKPVVPLRSGFFAKPSVQKMPAQQHHPPPPFLLQYIVKITAVSAAVSLACAAPYAARIKRRRIQKSSPTLSPSTSSESSEAPIELSEEEMEEEEDFEIDSSESAKESDDVSEFVLDEGRSFVRGVHRGRVRSGAWVRGEVKVRHHLSPSQRGSYQIRRVDLASIASLHGNERCAVDSVRKRKKLRQENPYALRLRHPIPQGSPRPWLRHCAKDPLGFGKGACSVIDTNNTRLWGV